MKINTIVVFILSFALSWEFESLTTKYILVGLKMQRPEHMAIKSWESLLNIQRKNKDSDVETGSI